MKLMSSLAEITKRDMRNNFANFYITFDFANFYAKLMLNLVLNEKRKPKNVHFLSFVSRCINIYSEHTKDYRRKSKEINPLLSEYNATHEIPISIERLQEFTGADLKQYGVFAIHIQKILKKPNIFYNIGELGQDKLTRQRALKLKQLDNQLVEIIKIAENVDANWSTLRNARKQYHIQRDEEQEYFKRIKKESTYLDGSGDKKKAIKNQKDMIICILWMRELNKIN